MTENESVTRDTQAKRALITKDLSDAADRFLEQTEDDPSRRLLLLVDPIRAFSEAGVDLNRAARKLVRRLHPEVAYGNEELYEGVRSGSIKLGWIDDIEFGKVVRAEVEPEIDPEIRKELGL
jgi:hypothetical protein